MLRELHIRTGLKHSFRLTTDIWTRLARSHVSIFWNEWSISILQRKVEEKKATFFFCLFDKRGKQRLDKVERYNLYRLVKMILHVVYLFPWFYVTFKFAFQFLFLLGKKKEVTFQTLSATTSYNMRFINLRFSY